MEHYLFVILLFLMYYLGFQTIGVVVFTILSSVVLRFNFDRLIFWMSDTLVNLFYIGLSVLFIVK